jgi:hypothetical protein
MVLDSLNRIIEIHFTSSARLRKRLISSTRLILLTWKLENLISMAIIYAASFQTAMVKPQR